MNRPWYRAVRQLMLAAPIMMGALGNVAASQLSHAQPLGGENVSGTDKCIDGQCTSNYITTEDKFLPTYSLAVTNNANYPMTCHASAISSDQPASDQSVRTIAPHATTTWISAGYTKAQGTVDYCFWESSALSGSKYIPTDPIKVEKAAAPTAEQCKPFFVQFHQMFAEYREAVGNDVSGPPLLDLDRKMTEYAQTPLGTACRLAFPE